LINCYFITLRSRDAVTLTFNLIPRLVCERERAGRRRGSESYEAWQVGAHCHCSLLTFTVQCSLSLFIVHCSMFTAHCSLLTAHCSLLTAHCKCSQFNSHCSQFTAQCLLFIAYSSMVTVHCSLFTTHSSLLTVPC